MHRRIASRFAVPPLALIALIALIALTGLAGCSASDSPASSTAASSTVIPSSSATSSASVAASPQPSSSMPSATTAPASSSASASAAAGPGWAEGDDIHLKVIAQLFEAVEPDACAGQTVPGSKVGVGTPVTLKDEAGTVLAESTLREVDPGEAYGPQGYTFGGWTDLPKEKGKEVTYACFYVADFSAPPPAGLYLAEVKGGQGPAYDVALLQESDGWMVQLIE